MKIVRIMGTMALAAVAMLSFNAQANNINADNARMAASQFFKQHAASTISFKAPAVADIKLVHSEASNVEGNAYYVFNVQGGGWVIIAGDDRAKQVLAYNTEGSLNMNNLPESTKSYLDKYKEQIEMLKAYKGKTEPLKAPKRITPVAPLLKSQNWSQHNPFYNQCVFNGQYCSVGCAGLAMAQILNYWEYPKECDGLSGYSPSWSLSIPSLPATTFDYDKILNTYLVWTEDGRLAWADGVTDENKDEVAKLCRYASQSCLMNFSPDGSGSNVTKQYNGFLSLGYDTNAKLVGIEAWPTRETWNTWDYTDEEWTALMNAQLEAHHPIPYSSEDFTDGHSFVVDGVDADGLYHVSWGWNGRGDGWFQHGAFNVTVQGQSMEFNTSLFMVIDLCPYEGYVSPNDPGNGGETNVGDVNGDGNVNISDVTLLIDYLLNQDGTGLDLIAGDCDGNGEINISDVTILIDKLLN